MTRESILRLFVLIIAFASPQADGYRRQTSVLLTPHDPEGRVISFTRADIYLDIWGGGQLVALSRAGQSAVVRLDQECLCSAWADVCKNRMYGPSRLILQANGYAPVTAVVYWPSPTESARIELSGGRRIGIDEGSSRSYDVVFHRPSPHTVRIVDESGKPAPGISVDASIYFEATNHSGVVEGESIVDGKTDADGRLTMPDVDGEVAIELQRGRYVLQNPDSVSPFRKIVTPEGTAPLTLVIHRFEKLPLNLKFVSRNGSAAGLILGTCLRFCEGACCGDEAITDAMGQIRIEDFYPEEIESLYLTNTSGTVLWKGTPLQIGASAAIPTITIP